jgi:hypothetical protein
MGHYDHQVIRSDYCEEETTNNDRNVIMHRFSSTYCAAAAAAAATCCNRSARTLIGWAPEKVIGSKSSLSPLAVFV